MSSEKAIDKIKAVLQAKLNTILAQQQDIEGYYMNISYKEAREILLALSEKPCEIDKEKIKEAIEKIKTAKNLIANSIEYEPDNLLGEEEDWLDEALALLEVEPQFGVKVKNGKLIDDGLRIEAEKPCDTCGGTGNFEYSDEGNHTEPCPSCQGETSEWTKEVKKYLSGEYHLMPPATSFLKEKLKEACDIIVAKDTEIKRLKEELTKSNQLHDGITKILKSGDLDESEGKK